MRSVTLAFLAALAGCAGLKAAFPTTPYAVSLCATGAVPMPCRALGKIDVPEAGATLAQLAVLVAGPELLKQAHLKACVFQTNPPEISAAGIRLTATAACTLRGVPVDEQLIITFVPVGAG